MNDTVPVPGYEGFYEVDREGNIYSLERTVYRKCARGLVPQAVPRKLRKPVVHGTGYRVVRLTNTKKVTTHRVHRLVALAFIDNPENKPFVNHKNGLKWDNRAANLEWVSEKENTAHAMTTGLKPTNRRCNQSGRYLKKMFDNQR